ncbi:MAG: DUF3822 family protein [Bacteroidaceae bacterium]|nr:DUF3822 family protein [Bacteroidaceae bacterium]
MQVTGSNSVQHILSIRFSADGFYFVLFNPKAKEGEDSYTYYIYKVNESLSLTANLKQALTDLEWLSYSYQAVNLLIDTPRFTLMPLDLFEDEQTETVFYHNFKRIDNETVGYNILQKSNAVVLFGIDKAFHSLLLEQFPNAQLQAQTTPLIEYLSTRNRQARQRQMFCFIASDRITITAMERRNLLLCNSFESNCTADRLYYILYCWKQLGFDQLTDELLLADNTPEAEGLKQELSRYIQQIESIASPTYLDLESIIL